jgi:hypothetical protein
MGERSHEASNIEGGRGKWKPEEEQQVDVTALDGEAAADRFRTFLLCLEAKGSAPSRLEKTFNS